MLSTDSTLVKDLSEREVLDLILPLLAGPGGGDSAEIGPGDDAAYVLPGTPGGGFLVSVDAVVEGQDFLWRWPNGHEHAPEDIGWKSIAQNLSDINAMGGVPRHVFLSLQCPGTTPIARLLGIARGMREALDALAPGCRVSGGDLGIASELTSTVTVLGEPTEAGPVRRSEARPGHVLALAGQIGWAAAGVDALLSSDAQNADARAVAAQLRPQPPMTAGPAAARAGASALMDVSDGLVRDAYRLVRASRVSLRLDAEALARLADELPAEESQTTDRRLDWVLNGGEDFPLLAAFPPSSPLPEQFIRIGEAIEQEEGGVFLGERLLAEQGFDHFAQGSETNA